MVVRHQRAARAVLAAASLVVAALAAPALATALAPDPRLDWRTLSTPHFRVHFPAELEAQGRRAAADAERA